MNVKIDESPSAHTSSVGNEDEFTHTVTVSAATLAKFVEKFVPQAVMKGRTIELAKWLAYDYSTGERNETPVTVSVDGNVLSDWKWTPQRAGVSTLKFSATNKNGTQRVEKKVETVETVCEMVAIGDEMPVFYL